ncbi:23S rRNA (adenine(2503)-C(2))-methyltransferase RlmN [Aquirhabdus sp.]|uniref:23S rRNA (adenine(2503)-C(2))-methyltransferase RlmN n=1 Tax=Aquirhabdus sp. TaxID=2824160 RepID=UPI00396C5BC6
MSISDVNAIAESQISPESPSLLAQADTLSFSASDAVQPFAPSREPDQKLSQASAEKVNLLGMTRKQLEGYFESIGEKKFRAAQVTKWIHQLGVTDFNEMTNLAGPLREKLSSLAYVAAPEVVHREFAKDGTRKWVFRVGEGAGSLVETVLIPAEGRKTLCISSQVGCALDCSFCSTGKQGFQRDLTPAEIIGQLWVANQSYMEDIPVGDRIRTVTNVVMMGMGEPLLNFVPVVSSMQLMLDDHAYGMSKRRVTLSTSGIVPMIDKLGDEIDVALAISLHAPNDELRNELVPINKKYPLAELIAAARRYVARGAPESEKTAQTKAAQKNSKHAATNPTNKLLQSSALLEDDDDTLDDVLEPSRKKHVTIEYVMLDGVNDQQKHAKQLIQLLGDLPSKINLIPFNPFPHAPYERSGRERIMTFQKTLADAGFVCTVRATRGDDIDAACGQLVGQVADRTRRAERWKQKVVEQKNKDQQSTEQKTAHSNQGRRSEILRTRG